MSRPQRLGVLAGSFNPPTIAHEELVYAAGFHVDEVLCVVPSVLPHKEYFGATLEQRLAMLEAARLMPPCSIATSEKGLFIDIARECREHYGPDTRLSFICGRDAAERILAWDYGRPGVVEEMLKEFELLVAARSGEFQPPAEFQHRIHPLGLRAAHDQVSSTEVRERIARGEPWEHLVPGTIVERVREIYS
ncbi:MAG TPA: nicotinate-nicotinamide nucleotide adenylyltransferase [Bryobacteraceae bacterium]|nr:nicotinate-nicotinamide nucleotide adenylyltransferase [Bryobacteraceae bacterium]